MWQESARKSKLSTFQILVNAEYEFSRAKQTILIFQCLNLSTKIAKTPQCVMVFSSKSENVKVTLEVSSFMGKVIIFVVAKAAQSGFVVRR